jgi:hypothetical protein
MWKFRIRGKQIQDNTITNTNISASANIEESKLLLDFPTATLNSESVKTNADRRVDDTIKVSFPFILLRDVADGKTYKVYLENGTLVTEATDDVGA